MKVDKIKRDPHGGYRWHNMLFRDYPSLEVTVIASSALVTNDDPKTLTLIQNKNDDWEIVRHARIVAIKQVYLENGNSFPSETEM